MGSCAEGTSSVTKIVLELDVHECHMLLPAITDKRLAWSKAAADAEADVYREYGEVAAAILSRLETQLCDQMFPETVARA